MTRGNPRHLADVPDGAHVDTHALISDDFTGAACRADPRMWDIEADARNPGREVRAVIACYACPVLYRCARYLATVEPPPVGVVWAGQVLDRQLERTPRWRRAFQRTISRYTHGGSPCGTKEVRP